MESLKAKDLRVKFDESRALQDNEQLIIGEY